MATPNWQVTHSEVRTWFEQGQPLADFDAVCDALESIVADPHGAGERLHDQRAPLYRYDIDGTNLRLVYLVVDQFHTVKVVSIIRDDQAPSAGSA